MYTSAVTGQGLLDLRQALLDNAPEHFVENPAILGDLVGPGELAVLVVPIDKEAPKGRLILPQVQAIRDLLDTDAMCLVVKERELQSALDRLNRPPKLVVTDSQAFLKVAADTPRDVPMTSFSILFARFKGDLIHPGGRARWPSRVCVPATASSWPRACSHHPIGDDIGRVKIPRWLTQYVGRQAGVRHGAGTRLPDDLSPYRLVDSLRRLHVRTAGRCSAGCCAAGKRACRSPTTAWSSPTASASSSGRCEPFPAALELVRNAQAQTLQQVTL